MSIGAASRSPLFVGNEETILWQWNETDLSQFEEAYRTPGADGVLSVDTNLDEPYQPILKMESAGGGAVNDYVFWRLLNPNGSRLVIPPRAKMSCLLGPRSSAAGANYGQNVTPHVWLWYVDEEHRIGLNNQLISADANSLSLIISNGDGDPHARSGEGLTNLKPDFRDSGDPVFLDLDMRKPSAGVDPGGRALFGGDFGEDTHQVILGSNVWTPYDGGTPPSTAWSAGWNGEVNAAIGFHKPGTGTGITHISRLVITVPKGY